ncbi:MAG: amidohydrolase family protein, partial [Steroidobacteraceae bacterium]
LTEIDADGQFVAPGFINIHSHAEIDAIATAHNMLTQGVTTEIINADGDGQTDINVQLRQFASQGLADNLGAYIGFNAIWQEVMGQDNHRPNATDIAKMRELVRNNLAAGAWGVSAGLDYPPAFYATTDEAIQVLVAAADWRTNFPNHERLRPELNFSSRAGIAETIQIAEAAGLTPEITHIKAQGHEQGRAGDIVAMLKAVSDRGHYAAADVYPYLAGETNLAAFMIPGWAQEGGRAAMLQRLKDPAQRSRIIQAAEQAMNARFGGPGGVYLTESRQELTAVIRDRRISAGEAVMQLLEQSDADVILRFGAEPDLIEFLNNPSTAIACDCGASHQTALHPRYYGTFPRVLGRYVRERGILSWEEAVRRMTSLPAAIIGAVDRGYLAPGMAADVVVFDPTLVGDNATYERPLELSTGVRDVVVNGVIALRNSVPTGMKAGKIMARNSFMPTRPTTAPIDRFLHIEGILTTKKKEKRRIQIKIDQAAGQRAATGEFRMTTGRGQSLLRSVELGTLQIAPKWASFTAAITSRAGSRLEFATVIIDAGNHLSGCPDLAMEVRSGETTVATGCFEGISAGLPP